MSIPIYRVRASFITGPTGPAVSTFYFLPSSSVSSTEAQAAVDKVRDFLVPFKPAILATFTWTIQAQVDVLDALTGDLLQWFTVTSRTDGGSGTGEQLPSANQALVRLSTAGVRNGKRVRGRIFLPGSTELASDSLGHPAGAWLSGVATAMTSLTTGSTPSAVVWARPKGPHGAIQTGQVYSIQAGSMAPFFAVLRSRRD